jgi:hypothetical protein
VIVAYRPREGKERKLFEVVKDHLPAIRDAGPATKRPPYVIQSKDGTIVEVFEWTSNAAVEDARRKPADRARRT